MAKLFGSNKVMALRDPSKRKFLLGATAFVAATGTVGFGLANETLNRDRYSFKYASTFNRRYGVNLSPEKAKIANDYLRSTKRLPTLLGSTFGAALARIPQHDWDSENDERGPFRKASDKFGLNAKGGLYGFFRSAITSLPLGLARIHNNNQIGLGSDYAQSTMEAIAKDLEQLGLEATEARVIASAAYIERIRSFTLSAAAVTTLGSAAIREQDPGAPSRPDTEALEQ